MAGRKLLIVLLLLFFWTISLRHLTVVPKVYEDEPWQASTGWKLASEGVLGTDLFAGFHGMEEHYYGYMPLHPFLLAGIFRLAGLGLFQARFEPVMLGLLTLALTYSLGKRLFHPEVGLLAVLLLLVSGTTSTSPSQISGVLFLDIPRISRYDMLVPVFGLAALHTAWSAAGAGVYGRSSPARRTGRWLLAGLLSGLAGLSHLYGVFWLIALALLLMWLRAGWRPFLALGAGFVLPWLPYLFYVLQAPADWAGQMRDYAPRFEVLNPAWYGGNLLGEARRYGPGLGAPGPRWLLRPGFWAFLLVVPFSLLALGRQMLRGDRAAAWLFIPAVTLPLLFALLIHLKLSNYLVTILPLLALSASWGITQLRHKIGAGAAPSGLVRAIRVGLILLLLAVAVEGLQRVARIEQAARTTTSYADFIAGVRAHIPAGRRVLGLHNYWFGMVDYDYRSWAVPLLRVNAGNREPSLTIAQALDDVAPDVILIDPRVAVYLAERPTEAAAIADWMSAHGFSRTALIENTTYGPMEIYLMAEPARAAP